MKYRSYTVDDSFIVDGTINWKITGNGNFIIGTKDGRKYFIKRRFEPIYPDRSLDADLRALLSEEIVPIEKKQLELQKRMSVYDTFKDNIAIEEELICGDEDNRFVTVTNYFENILPDDFDYTSLSKTEYIELIKKMAEALDKLHKVNVTHGDLKPQNFVIVKEGKNYKPYVIDFDISFPSEQIPNIMPGSMGYYSPEEELYNEVAMSLIDDPDIESKVDKSNLSDKVDVFSLGLVYHVLWSGIFPSYGTENSSVAEALNNGKTITISSKFNQTIGDINKATIKSLINWMLAKDPKDRPTMSDVYEVLNDTKKVDTSFIIGDDELNIMPILWPKHLLMVERGTLTVDYLIGKNIDEFFPTSKVEGEEVKYLYSAKFKGDPTIYVFTIDDLVERGILTKVKTVFDQPYEDNVELVSEEELVKKGIISIERFKEEYTGRNRYRITLGNTIFTKSVTSLIQMGLAKYKEVDTTIDSDLFDAPWNSNLIYNKHRLQESKIASIKRTTDGMYLVKWEEDEREMELEEKLVVNMGFLKNKEI